MTATPDPAPHFFHSPRLSLVTGLRESRARRRAIAGLLLAAFLWGAGNVANKTVQSHVDPYTAVLARCLFAMAVLIPFLRRDGAPIVPSRAATGSVLLLSLLFAVALILQQVAFGLTTVTNASFLVNTAGPMTPLVAWLAIRARPGRVPIAAAAIMLGGIYLMSGGEFAAAKMNIGDLACLASAACYAAWTVALGHHAMRHGRPLHTTLLQFAWTAALVAPVVALTQSPSLSDLGAALPQLAMLGVFSTGFAFLLLAHAQSRVSAPTAAIIVSAESLFGAAGAFLLLNERLSVWGFVGAVLILLAIVVTARAGDAR